MLAQTKTIILKRVQFLLFLLNCLLLPSQTLTSFHSNSWNNIGRFEKLEVGVTIPADIEIQIESFLNGLEGINPYDFNQIKIDAYFSNSDITYNREGFYFREIIIDKLANTFTQHKSKFPFRIRFCPPGNGNYSFVVTLTVNGKAIFNSNGNFTVVESGKRGSLSLGSYKHLKDYHNKPFVALGQNIPFCDYPSSLIQPDDFERQRGYINDLADNSGNFFRIRLDPWSNEIELEELGVYGSKRKQNENFERQWHAYELDQTFDLAERRNIYMFLTLLGDYHFSNKLEFQLDWRKNPYKKLVSEPNDFFNIEGESFAIYKNKIRYILARYGYSANLAVIGLINETDHLENYSSKSSFRSTVDKWVKAMGAYIKDEQFYPQHLLTNGYSAPPTAPDPGIDNSILFDIITRNNYTNSRRAIKALHDDKVNKLLTSPDSKKPFIFGEIGTGLCPPTHEDWFSDAEFHNNLWATVMFYRSFGNGLFWWDWEQESHLVPDNKSVPGMQHRLNFKALSTFFTKSPPPFETEEFTSNWDCDLGVLGRLENRKVEWIENVNKSGTKGFGWVHNSDYYWINDPLRLTSDNCPNCLMGGMEAFYDSDCYSEQESDVALFNEPKGPYLYGKKHEEITLSGFKPLRNYKVEIWSCYEEGGFVTILSERANAVGKLKFKRNVGVFPGDKDFGDPDFAYKVRLSDETFEKSVSIYPNPFENTFTIDADYDILRIVLYNSAGIELTSQGVDPVKSMTYHFPGEQPQGVYIIRVELSGGFVNYIKLIKL